MSNSEHPEQQPLQSAANASQKKPVRRKHIDFLSLQQQRELRDKEQIIKDCIAFKEANNGRLPRGEGTAAMKQLKIKSRRPYPISSSAMNFTDGYILRSLR